MKVENKKKLTEEEKKKIESKKDDFFEVEFDPEDNEGSNINCIIGIIN